MTDRLFVVTTIENKSNSSSIFKKMDKAWSRFYTEVAWMINKHGTVFTIKDESSMKTYEWTDGSKLVMSFGYMDDED